MSYPSVRIIAEKHGLNPDAMSDHDAEHVLWHAFEADLPLGFVAINALAQQAAELDEGAQPIVLTRDPKSLEGQQIIRMMFDVPRAIFEKKYGVYLTAYNCCSVEAQKAEKGKERPKAKPSRQMLYQGGPLASADC